MKGVHGLVNMIDLKWQKKWIDTLPYLGRACAYKIGEIKIKELRKKAELELGSKFNIKEFHHRILSCGRIPIRILETIIDHYIQEVQAAS
ncbi:hypothetical protein Btru_066042 [Bulinus truncatus]|nr:hypothetical protein Btru_066042 [Bulinus truncatus]